MASRDSLGEVRDYYRKILPFYEPATRRINVLALTGCPAILLVVRAASVSGAATRQRLTMRAQPE